eukprot:31018-Pelagococcus_subviridis.AAC.32
MLNSLHTTVATPRKKCGRVIAQKPRWRFSTVTYVSCGGGGGDDDDDGDGALAVAPSPSPSDASPPPDECDVFSSLFALVALLALIASSSAATYSRLGANTASTRISRSFAASPSSSRGYVPKSSFAANCAGLTYIETITTSATALARRTSSRWPSCRYPIVGTSAILRPAARCARDHARIVAEDSMTSMSRRDDAPPRSPK